MAAVKSIKDSNPQNSTWLLRLYVGRTNTEISHGLCQSQENLR